MSPAKCECGREYIIGYYDHGKCVKCLGETIDLLAELDGVCRKLDMLVDLSDHQDRRDTADKLIDALELVLLAKKMEDEHEPDES